MGNCVVTASWTSTPNDAAILKDLTHITTTHGISISEFPQRREEGSTQFSAEIGGLSIIWHGGQSASTERLRQLSLRWADILRLYGVRNVNVRHEYLPM